MKFMISCYHRVKCNRIIQKGDLNNGVKWLQLQECISDAIIEI